MHITWNIKTVKDLLQVNSRIFFLSVSFSLSSFWLFQKHKKRVMPNLSFSLCCVTLMWDCGVIYHRSAKPPGSTTNIKINEQIFRSILHILSSSNFFNILVYLYCRDKYTCKVFSNFHPHFSVFSFCLYIFNYISFKSRSFLLYSH